MHLALFDFDGTLSTRDSLMPFLRHHAGTARFVHGLLATSPALGAYALRLMRNDVAKQQLLRWFLRGQTVEMLEASGQRFATGPLAALLRPTMMQRLREHQQRGDTCVLVSASLGCYLRPWAVSQGFEAVLCSELASQDGGVTGQLVGANCHGPEKVRRIQTWLNGRTPTHISAYGDSSGDTEMLALADSPHYRDWA